MLWRATCKGGTLLPVNDVCLSKQTQFLFSHGQTCIFYGFYRLVGPDVRTYKPQQTTYLKELGHDILRCFWII